MITTVQEKFKEKFGDGASYYSSPGRINLIGEHTDYNLGFVLPAAVDKSIYVAIRATGGVKTRVYSVNYDKMSEFDLNGEQPSEQWASYVYGVVQEMKKRGAKVPSFDCSFGGDVPLGTGMSSSAALESAIGFAVNDIFTLGFTRIELAKIGQMTEHNYIGVRCGIMDQFISLLGEKGKVLQLDCRSLDYTLKPFDIASHNLRLVLVDSMVKHTLASSEYNIRRSQCEAGVKVIAQHVNGVESLRDVTIDMLNTYKAEMEAIEYQRCAYVINENQRLLEGCDLLEKGDYAGFGKKMYGSHDGLSKEYEVSCVELDFIANVARGTDGMLGARMMGGGFGGCVIHLMNDEIHDSYINNVQSRFNAKFGVTPRVIDVVIGDGAKKL